MTNMSEWEEYWMDEWPKMPDGTKYDGKDLLTLVRDGNNPFRELWDVSLLIREVEEKLETKVSDIPMIHKGSNNYGIHFKLYARPDVVARLSRCDVNMPNFNGKEIGRRVSDGKFEAHVYRLLQKVPGIPVSRILHHRLPVKNDGPKSRPPQDIAGRQLCVFERAQGENNVWRELSFKDKTTLLSGAARIRASLYDVKLTKSFTAIWLFERLFDQKPESFPIPVAPTREFCIALLESKIKATIRNIGDMIGWESDNVTVGPKAAAVKQSILRLIPHILPRGGWQIEEAMYRLVLEHGDYGIHNMLITKDTKGNPVISSVFDWETACIWPALLTDPEMAVPVDLGVDEYGKASISRDKGITDFERAEYMMNAQHYTNVLFVMSPFYETVIKHGKDARYLWNALRRWRGKEPERYFGTLGAWAEMKLGEYGVH